MAAANITLQPTGRAAAGVPRLVARLVPGRVLCDGGFATIPTCDEDGLSPPAVNRMITAAIRGAAMRERP